MAVFPLACLYIEPDCSGTITRFQMMFYLRKTQNPLLKKQRVLCYSVLSI